VNGTCGAQALYPGACVTEWVVDATRLYWTCSTSGTVMAAPKDGSGPVTTLASGQTGATGIAIDATQLYWTAGAVMVMPLAGSGETMLTTLGTSGSLIRVGGGYAWVMDGMSLIQVPVGGGPAVLAWTGGILMGLTVDASQVYWSTLCTSEEGGQFTQGLAYAMPLAGGAVTSNIFFNGDFLLRLIPWAGSILGVAIDGGNCGPMATADAVESVFGFELGHGGTIAYVPDGATDGSTVYWAGPWDWSQMVVKKPGLPWGGGALDGPLVDLPATRLAVDDTYVYLYANGTISRAFK